MGEWYQVVKTIKGNQYRYLQQTYREGGRVRTRNRYLGRVDTQASGSHPPAPTTKPLFQSPSDFGAAMLNQFDAPQWGKDAGNSCWALQSQGLPLQEEPAKPAVPARDLILEKTLSTTKRQNAAFICGRGASFGNLQPCLACKAVTMICAQTKPASQFPER